MSLALCIPDMLAKGEIDDAQAAEMAQLFGRYERHSRRGMGDAAAAARASEETVAALERAALQRKRRSLMQVQGQRSAWLDMQKFGGGAGGIRALDPADPGHIGKAAAALLIRSEYAPYRNVEYMWKAIRGEAHATIAGILEKHSRNMVGEVRQKAELAELVREIFQPGSTGSANARELAEAWHDAAEALRLRFNAAGGDVAKLDGWGLPQAHDSDAIEAAGFDSWREFITPLLDRSRMIDRATGQPFDDADLDLVLRDVFDTIATDGWSTREAGARTGGTLGTSRTDHRFLIFGSADNWMAYQERFGRHATAFDAMNLHIDGMARDIALMERLGPDPASTIRWLNDASEKAAALAGGRKNRDAAYAQRRRVERIFGEIMGENRRPENRRLALGFSTIRSFQVATKLGSAVLSTTSDQATQILARRVNGIPVARGWATQLKLLNPADAGDRELAIRMGLIAEEASGMAAATSRMTGEELTGDVSRRLAEGVLRVSGLNAVTQAGRWAFGMDFLAHIASERGRGWGQLDEAFQGAFSRYGMGEREWDAIRATPLREERGARWIMADDIADRRVRDDMMRMILTETDFAVMMPSIELKAAMNGALPKGTIVGELGRTAFQFKSFAVGLGMMQYQRMMARTGWSRASYAAQMFLLTTAMGGVALQLKEVAKGRDPRPIYDADDPQATAAFWGAAGLQGGGLGIFGDFLKSTQSRFGGGISETLAGPAFQTADTLIGTPLRLAGQTIRDEKVNPRRELIRAIKSETPGGSLWFARLGFERIILDEAARQIDPGHAAAWRRQARYAGEQGQDFWWAPGDGLDRARAPDVGNLVVTE